MVRRSSGRWWLQSAYGVWWRSIFSLSNLDRLPLSVRRSAAVSSSDLWRTAVHGQEGNWLRKVAFIGFSNLSVLLLSVVCAGGFLYHGGNFVSFNTQLGWCLSSMAGSRWSCQRFKELSYMPLEWLSALPPHLRSSS